MNTSRSNDGDADNIQIVSQMATTADANLPLVQGLRIIASETRGKRRRTLVALIQALESGKSLRDASATHLKQSPYLSGLLGASIASNNFPGTVTNLVDCYRRSSQLWKRLWLLISYPLLLMAFLLVIVALVVGVIVPQIAQIIMDFDVTVPGGLQSLIWLSEQGWRLFYRASLGILLLLIAIRVLCGRVGWMQVLSSIPGFGRMLHWHGYVETCRLLQLLLRQQMALPDALSLTASAVRNANVASIVEMAASEIKAGKTLSEVLAARPDSPAPLVSVVRVGERRGDLVEALTAAGDMLESFIAARADFLSAVIPPILFVGIATIVVGLVFSLLFPFISLMSFLSW